MSSNLEVFIKYFSDIDKIEKIKNGDWIDLRCSENIVMLKGQYKLIPLGVAIKLPTGYEALVAPRSSTFKHHGVLLANSLGVIDETYCGESDEWKFPAYATKDIYIPKNTRICQFRIIEHQPEFDIIEDKSKFSSKNRGGIGSTGII